MPHSGVMLREKRCPGQNLASVPHSASAAVIAGQYIPALDGLRGLAILLVMGYHFGQDADGGGTALGPFMSRVFGVGYHGVDLFFVLSGFLITGILLDMKDRPRYFRNFYIRRVLRIFPLYYGVLVCVLVLLPLVVTPPVFPFAEAQRHQAWLWLYASNIYHAWTGHWRLTGFSHLWSLAVEEHFYLIWPVVIFFCRARGALVVSAACLVASLACRTGFALCGNEAALYALTPCRMDGLAIGAFIALVARGPRSVHSLVPWALASAVISAFSIAAIVWWNRSLSTSGHSGLTIRFTLYSLFFGAIVVFALTSETTSLAGRVWNSRLLRFFGKYSYGLYVFHYPLIPVLILFFPMEQVTVRFGSAFLAKIVYMAVAITASLVLAMLSWHLYEKQFLKLKEVLASRRA